MIIAITGKKNSLRPFEEQLELIAKGGPDMILVRDKNADDVDYLEFAKKCKEICMKYHVAMAADTHLTVAKELGVYHIQVPFDFFV